jgi:arsenate reductase-like glutaredoxin family protein
MNEITLYGIKNCDTVKKARKWLDENDITHRFHDVRADGLIYFTYSLMKTQVLKAMRI